jgi:hypothetical protein
LVGINGNIILKCMFNKHYRRMWAELAWFRRVSAVGSCEQGREPKGFVKAGNFFNS